MVDSERATEAASTATIGDVAAAAGVSTATVSRVLAGVGHARPETRARVLEAARSLDYRPSEVARALKRRSTQTLGLIVTDIENPYFPQLVRSVEDAAREAGYFVLLGNAADDPDREGSYLDLLADRRVDGLIVAASSLGGRHRAWLAAPRVPVVLVNTMAPDVALPAVLSDNEEGGRVAAVHLLELGHRTFAYLMPPARNEDAAARLAGVREALAAADRDTALVVTTGDALVPGGERAALDVLDRAPETTAIIAYNDLMAIGALRALRSRGRRVPADASVIGFDDIAVAAYIDPPLSTIVQRTDEMGRWAVGRLTGAVDGPDTLRLPVELRIRESTGPAPA